MLTLVRPCLHTLGHCEYGGCFKAYPWLGYRSIFYPAGSAGSTFTFDVVDDTGSNLTSNINFVETLARVSWKHISLCSKELERSMGRHGKPHTEKPSTVRSQGFRLSEGARLL